MKWMVKFTIFIFGLCAFLFAPKMSTHINAENMWKKLEVSWGYERTNMDDFLEKLNGLTSEEVVVAILDTGIDSDHEWFYDANGNSRILHEYAADCALKVGREVRCYNRSDDINVNYEDIDGHGTHVAGIIAKATPDNVKIIPLQGSTELLCDGSDCLIDGEAIKNAFKYIIDLKVNHGVNIVALNYSVGNDYHSHNDSYYQRLASLVSDAYDAGIFFVVAAGNERDDTTKSWMKLEKAQKAIMVSALNMAMHKADFSNYGDEVDFAAPGTAIFSAKVGGGVTSKRGTSMAAPHVAADIALLYSMCPTCTLEQIEAILFDSAVDIGEEGKDPKYGHGYIDMNIAWEKLQKYRKIHTVTVIIKGKGIISGLPKKTDQVKSRWIFNTTYTFSIDSGMYIALTVKPIGWFSHIKHIKTKKAGEKKLSTIANPNLNYVSAFRGNPGYLMKITGNMTIEIKINII